MKLVYGECDDYQSVYQEIFVIWVSHILDHSASSYPKGNRFEKQNGGIEVVHEKLIVKHVGTNYKLAILPIFASWCSNSFKAFDFLYRNL